MHTPSAEHHGRIDSVDISEPARKASLREQLEQADRDGNPVVKGGQGSDKLDAVEAAMVLAVLFLIFVLYHLFTLLILGN